ncbi:MAG: hypothetical protein AAFN11_10135 [Chloroflexota bacterium]
MKVERYQPRQRFSTWQIACGCLGIGSIGIVLTGLLAAFIFPRLPALLAPAVGLEEVADIDDIFVATEVIVPDLANAQSVPSITLNTGSFSQTLTDASTDYSVVVGESEETLAQQVQVSFTEQGLRSQCQQLTPICSLPGDTIRNASFDFRSGGMVINGEFEVQTGVWQSAGLVVQVTDANTLDIVGVQVGGTVFAPMNTDMSALVNEAESRANALLNQLSATSGIDSYTLQAVVIDESTMTLILN